MDAEEAGQYMERIAARATRVDTVLPGGGKMAWRRWGEGAGLPLVLLHGGAGSWMHWIRSIEHLAQGRAVWIPDMPGFGDSDLPGEGLDADTLAPMVRAGMLEVLRGARFELVGFSFGSLVAGAIAADAPPTLERVILVSASALGLFQAPAEMKSMKGVADPAQRLEIARFNLNAMMLHNLADIDGLALAVHRQSASRERVKNRKLARTDYLLKLAPQWKVPVYGIWGREDYAYRTQFDKLLEVIGQLHLRGSEVIEDAGHWVQYERPEQFHRALERQLAHGR